MAEDNEWRSEALCAPRDGLPSTEVHVAKWFPRFYYHGSILSDEAQAAIAICDQCPSEMSCRAWAIATRQREGIWGGTTPQDRGRLRRRKFAA